jgi:hypothetical protein
MDRAVLNAAEKLLYAGTEIEEQLAKTLSKCDGIGHDLTMVVADALTKLVQDVAGAPLVLASFVSDPRGMICLITVLDVVLRKAQVERRLGASELSAVRAEVHAVCREHALPDKCCEVYVALVDEIVRTLHALDSAIAPPHVLRERNAEVLRRRVRHFFRAVCPELLVYAFNSLKLAVCMKAMLQGCFEASPKMRERIYATLRLVKKQARTMAAINDVHSQNVSFAAKICKASRD